MKKGLQRFHFTLRVYTSVVVPTLLVLTGIFFYFYFVIPDRESDVLFNFEVNADVQRQAIDARATTLTDLHRRKTDQEAILPGDVADIFSEDR